MTGVDNFLLQSTVD